MLFWSFSDQLNFQSSENLRIKTTLTIWRAPFQMKQHVSNRDRCLMRLANGIDVNDVESAEKVSWNYRSVFPPCRSAKPHFLSWNPFHPAIFRYHQTKELTRRKIKDMYQKIVCFSDEDSTVYNFANKSKLREAFADEQNEKCFAQHIQWFVMLAIIVVSLSVVSASFHLHLFNVNKQKDDLMQRHGCWMSVSVLREASKLIILLLQRGFKRSCITSSWKGLFLLTGSHSQRAYRYTSYL